MRRGADGGTFLGMLRTAPTPEAPERVVGRPFARGAESPNPGGRPKMTAAEREARELLRAKSPYAARKLIAMCENRHGKYSEAAELAATQAVLDRALGKPGVRDGFEVSDLQIVVRKLSIENVQPVPGVISSPVVGHVCPPRFIAAPGEVIDT